MRGYFGIGIENTKYEANIGTLWRSAHAFGASFIFTIKKRYEKQASDTSKTWRQIPLFHYTSLDEFFSTIPYSCPVIGLEFTEKATKINTFIHPERCIYLLGAEDHGLTNEAINKCHQLLILPGKNCLNVATAGSIVMYDRITKGNAWKLG